MPFPDADCFQVKNVKFPLDLALAFSNANALIAMNRYSKNIVITIQVIISKINIFPNIQTFYMHTKL